MIHVAVVMDKNGSLTSRRSDGSWACFTDEDVDNAVMAALTAARQWMTANPGLEYHVLVGELTLKAQVPVAFELVSVKSTRKGVRRRK